jgi:ferritin-like metal-binding protein YciE
MKQATLKEQASTIAKNQDKTPGAGVSTGNGKPENGKASNTNTNTSAGTGNGAPSLLEKFFLDQLKDIYYAEQKILKSLPKMKDAATTDELKDAFEDHLHQTERHVKRLEKVFEIVKQKPEGKKCEAIEGIIREADEIIEETQAGTMTRDAALIMAAQKVEHYEIATYGGLVQLAITMGLETAANILDKTLMEEEDTDQLLTDIAENDINLGSEEEDSHYSWEAKNVEATV